MLSPSDVALAGSMALGLGSGAVLCALLADALLTPDVTFWPAPPQPRPGHAATLSENHASSVSGSAATGCPISPA